MLEAHYSGLFDYSTFNWADQTSYTREVFALRYCFANKQKEISQLQLKQVESSNLLKLTSIPSGNLENVTKVVDSLSELYESNYELIWPGYKENQETTAKISTDVKDTQYRWESRFGDLDSSEVQEKLSRYEDSLKGFDVESLINKDHIINV